MSNLDELIVAKENERRCKIIRNLIDHFFLFNKI